MSKTSSLNERISIKRIDTLLYNKHFRDDNTTTLPTSTNFIDYFSMMRLNIVGLSELYVINRNFQKDKDLHLLPTLNINFSGPSMKTKRTPHQAVRYY